LPLGGMANNALLVLRARLESLIGVHLLSIFTKCGSVRVGCSEDRNKRKTLITPRNSVVSETRR
jgi:hypothetical protein